LIKLSIVLQPENVYAIQLRTTALSLREAVIDFEFSASSEFALSKNSDQALNLKSITASLSDKVVDEACSRYF
jgi:hypothetical protein